MAPPVIRPGSTIDNDDNGTLTPARPAGLAVDDCLLAVHSCDADGALADMTAAGFIELGFQAGHQTNNYPSTKIWAKVATASDVGASTFTFGEVPGASATVVLCAIQAGTYDSASIATTPLFVAQPRTSNQTITAPSVDPGIVDGLLVCGLTADTNNVQQSFPNPPTGMTTINQATSGYSLAGMFSQALTSTAATGTRSATPSPSSTANGWVAASLIVRPAAIVLGPPTVDAGPDVAGHTVNTVFSRTATENANGATITSRAWTITDRPGNDEPAASANIFSTSFAIGDFVEFNSCQWVGRNDNCQTYDGTSDYSATVTAIDGRPDVARFELRDGDVPPFGGGERTEVAAPGTGGGADDASYEGDEWWIGFDMKLDAAFPDPAGWGGVLWQMHPESSTASPPLVLDIDPSGHLGIANHDPSGAQRTDLGPADKGTWHRYLIHAKFSPDEAVGFRQMWIDGVQVEPRTACKTMIPGDTYNYMKLGYYRDNPSTDTAILYFDNVRIALNETIGTAAALSWTPTAIGSYTLQYAATNSEGTGADSMALTVTSGPPPTVDAGPDVTGWPVETMFTRTATATGSGITSMEWKVQSGPIDEGRAFSTTTLLEWTPLLNGTYVLRFSATNADGTSFDDMSIEVVQVPATPGEILNIGVGPGKNHFSVDIARSPTERELMECEQIEAGLEEPPFFTGTSDYTRCSFYTQVNAATTSGSSYPRSELREVEPGGSVNMFWDPHDGGTHWIRGRSAYTHLMAVKPTLITSQLHSSDDDVIQVATQKQSTGQLVLLLRINGTSVGIPTFEDPYTPGPEFDWMHEILPPLNGQVALCRIYYQSLFVPHYTMPVTDMPVTAPGYYFKAGNYLNSNTSTEDGNSSEYGSSTLRNLQHWHTGWALPDNGFWGLPDVEAGADVSSPAGWSIVHSGTDGALDAERRWYVVDGPAGGSNVGEFISTTDTLTWAPTVQGDYRLRYGVTTDIGTNVDDIIVTVTEPVSAGGGFLPFFNA